MVETSGEVSEAGVGAVTVVVVVAPLVVLVVADVASVVVVAAFVLVVVLAARVRAVVLVVVVLVVSVVVVVDGMLTPFVAADTGSTGEGRITDAMNRVTAPMRHHARVGRHLGLRGSRFFFAVLPMIART